MHTENRHHLHLINQNVQSKLIERISYLQENFEQKDGPLYGTLKNIKGNILFYLATYPNLYTKIFQSLKDNDLNKEIGLTEEYIENMRRMNDENQSKLERLRSKNKFLHDTLKHVKALLDLKNPANSRNNEDISKNQDNSSIKSGNETGSRAGSVINDAHKPQIYSALSSLS